MEDIVEEKGSSSKSQEAGDEEANATTRIGKLENIVRTVMLNSRSAMKKKKERLEKAILKQDARLLSLATMFVGVQSLLLGVILQQSNLNCRTCLIPMGLTLCCSIGFLTGMWFAAKKYMNSLQNLDMVTIQEKMEMGMIGVEANQSNTGEPENGPEAHKRRVVQFWIAGSVMVACSLIVMAACPVVYCTGEVHQTAG